MTLGYCVKERKQVIIKDAIEITMKNGRPAVTGFCPDCGTKIFKVGKLNKKETNMLQITNVYMQMGDKLQKYGSLQVEWANNGSSLEKAVAEVLKRQQNAEKVTKIALGSNYDLYVFKVTFKPQGDDVYEVESDDTFKFIAPASIQAVYARHPNRGSSMVKMTEEKVMQAAKAAGGLKEAAIAVEKVLSTQVMTDATKPLEMAFAIDPYLMPLKITRIKGEKKFDIERV